MAENKTYCNGVYVREKTFASTGNTILNVSVNVEQMVAFLNQHKDEKGYVRLGISKRREVSDKGVTHTVWLDTWKPDGAPKQQAAAPARKDEPQADQQDDIPF